jgi:predicted nucleic-acid-binding Zn-ribbon protein
MKDLSDLRQRIKALSDDELRRMVHVDADDYRPEALAIASEEIRLRRLATGEPAAWTCVTCGSTVEGALHACGTCGTSFDGVEDRDFGRPEGSGPSAWTCAKCGELIEGALWVCWQCGTSVEGAEDPIFHPRDASTSDTDSDLDRQIAERFRCLKCFESLADVRRIATAGTGASGRVAEFVAVSCRKCGYTELYDPEVLGAKRVDGES